MKRLITVVSFTFLFFAISADEVANKNLLANPTNQGLVQQGANMQPKQNPASSPLATPQDKTGTSQILAKVSKTESQWRAQLTPEQYKVTREKGTEVAFTGKYWDSKQDGIYTCVCCGTQLFDSKAKFESDTGWPSYFQPISLIAVQNALDNSGLVPQVEVTCRRCDAHLGHVFKDGPQPTGLRYCINSAALDFKTRDQLKPSVPLKKFGAASEEALLDQLKAAVTEKSKQKFLDCTLWTKLPLLTREQYRLNEPFFANLDGELVSVEAVKQEPLEGSKFKGSNFNVNYVGQIKFVFSGQAEPVLVDYGELNGRFYLADSTTAAKK